MIRESTHEDVPKLVELMHSFKDEGLSNLCVGHDDLALSNSFHAMINSPLEGVWSGEIGGDVVGMLSGTVIIPWYASSFKVATQRVWYVHPSHRGGGMGVRLLKKFEEWCVKMGAGKIYQPFTLFTNPLSTSEILKKCGYRPTELWYSKEVM